MKTYQIIIATILANVCRNHLSAPIPHVDELVAGFVLYKVEDGKIEYVLLQKLTELDDWSPPKGKIDEGEDVRMGAIRETFEETSYLKEDYTPLFLKRIDFQYDTNGGITKKVKLFPAKLTDILKQVTLDLNEHADFEWLWFFSSPIPSLSSLNIKQLS